MLLCSCLTSPAQPAEPLRIGISPNPPKVFFNADHQADGILVELLRAIADAEKWELEFVPCDWEQCLRAVASGKLDLLPGVAPSPERSTFLDFHTTPALLSWTQLYRNRNVAIVSILDLQGKKVAIVRESIGEAFFADMETHYGVRPEMVPVKSLADGFQLAEQGKADVAVANNSYGDLHAASYGLIETPIVFQPVRLFYATSKGKHPDVLAAIDRHLRVWQRAPDSLYFEVLQRWHTRTLLSRIPAPLVWGATGIAALLATAVLLAIWLRRQVAKKTNDLHDREQKLAAILDSVESLVYVKDSAYRYRYVNQAVCMFLGKPEAALIGISDHELFDGPTAAWIHQMDRQVIEHGQRVEAEEIIPIGTETTSTFLSTKIPLYRGDGSVYALCGISTDISERKKAEESLRVAATVFQAQEGMFITSPDRIILKVNEAFTAMTGYASHELVGRPLPSFSLEPNGPDYRDTMWETVEQSNEWQGEIWMHRKGGKAFPAWMTVTTVHDEQGKTTNYVGTQADFTQQKRAQDEIMQLACYDSLTGLPNRRLLAERLLHCLPVHNRSKQALALLFLDLDNFKDLNDTRGHDAGDKLLKQVAQRIAGCVREGDTVARLGGDEFVILLESIGMTEAEAGEHAATIGWKILRVLGEPYDIDGAVYHATCSIGAALRLDHDIEIDDLMKRGDLAMYEAKREGRNTLRFFQHKMESDVTYRIALEMELRESLGKSGFVLHYQTQVDGGGRITGTEALLRWNHVKHGAVGPSVFVPIAESSGLIVQLGNWVLRGACIQLAEWALAPETAHLTIAVNVSARQFRQPDFVATTLAILKETGAKPSRLKLELTETLLVENVEDTIAKMRQLKNHGIGFALDDFGTGYSSLSYLKRLPLDQLKIDRSFVRDVLVDPNDASIARSIVALAKALGLGIIAEGVETEAQRRFLAEIGCECCQGYLFGRPMHIDMLQRMLDHAVNTR